MRGGFPVHVADAGAFDTIPDDFIAATPFDNRSTLDDKPELAGHFALVMVDRVDVERCDVAAFRFRGNLPDGCAARRAQCNCRTRHPVQVQQDGS